MNLASGIGYSLSVPRNFIRRRTSPTKGGPIDGAAGALRRRGSCPVGGCGGDLAGVVVVIGAACTAAGAVLALAGGRAGDNGASGGDGGLGAGLTGHVINL